MVHARGIAALAFTTRVVSTSICASLVVDLTVKPRICGRIRKTETGFDGRLSAEALNVKIRQDCCAGRINYRVRLFGCRRERNGRFFGGYKVFQDRPVAPVKRITPTSQPRVSILLNGVDPRRHPGGFGDR